MRRPFFALICFLLAAVPGMLLAQDPSHTVAAKRVNTPTYSIRPVDRAAGPFKTFADRGTFRAGGMRQAS